MNTQGTFKDHLERERVKAGQPIRTLESFAAAGLATQKAVDAEIAKSTERSCRRCGCTQNFACATSNGPCSWVEMDLCSACLTRPEYFRLLAGDKRPSRGVLGKVRTEGRKVRMNREAGNARKFQKVREKAGL